jgi:proline iminopeptidase
MPDRHSPSELLPLFPPVEPYASGMLDLDAPHRMYYEQSGNPRGVPVVFLHGGPGAGASAVHRQFFDPAFYRIVVLDQRGAGRSTPLGCLENNTTPHLVADLERLRQHLGIDRWMVFGGSWGSTLALAYAEHHPDRVRALVLRGIFLCRKSEIDWFLYGLRAIFPEAWRAFSGYIPESERGDLLSAYHARLVDPDPAVHMPAARSWSVYEGSCSTLLPNPALVADFASDRVALGLARIEAHYFRHDIFLPEDFLLGNVGRLKRIARGDRAGALRHRLPDRLRRRPAPRMARGGVHRRARRGTLGLRAGHPLAPHRRHREPQVAGLGKA